jgi:hypothetical protein
VYKLQRIATMATDIRPMVPKDNDVYQDEMIEDLFGTSHHSEADTCGEIMTTRLNIDPRGKACEASVSKQSFRSGASSTTVKGGNLLKQQVLDDNPMQPIDLEIHNMVRADVRKMIAKIKSGRKPVPILGVKEEQVQKDEEDESEERQIVNPGKYGEYDLRSPSAQARNQLFKKIKKEKIKKKKTKPTTKKTESSQDELVENPEDGGINLEMIVKSNQSRKRDYYKNHPEDSGMNKELVIKADQSKEKDSNKHHTQETSENTNATDLSSNQSIQSTITSVRSNVSSKSKRSSRSSRKARRSKMRTNVCIPANADTELIECIIEEHDEEREETPERAVEESNTRTTPTDEEKVAVDIREVPNESLGPKQQDSNEMPALEEPVHNERTDNTEETQQKPIPMEQRPDDQPALEEAAGANAKLSDDALEASMELAVQQAQGSSRPATQGQENSMERPNVRKIMINTESNKSAGSKRDAPAKSSVQLLAMNQVASDPSMSESSSRKQGQAGFGDCAQVATGKDDKDETVELVLVDNSEKLKRLQGENRKLKETLHFLQQTAVDKEKYYAELAWYGKRSEEEVRKWRPNFWEERRSDFGPQLFEEFQADAMRIADPDVGDWEHGFSSGCLAMARLLLGLSR